MYTVNIWATLVAAVVSFAVGALWYSPILFGKEWMALTKMSDSDMAEAKAKGMWRPYLIHFIATIVTFAVLAFVISVTGTMTASDGAFIAFLVWLGFIVPPGISALLWKREPFKLVLIDVVHMLVGLVIGGAILGGWR